MEEREEFSFLVRISNYTSKRKREATFHMYVIAEYFFSSLCWLEIAF